MVDIANRMITISEVSQVVTDLTIAMLHGGESITVDGMSLDAWSELEGYGYRLEATEEGVRVSFEHKEGLI